MNIMTEPAIVLIDFHNTLVSCDAWFTLEVRELASAVLEALGGDAATDAMCATVDDAYRTLRKEVQRSGREVDTGAALETILSDVPLGRRFSGRAITETIDRLERQTLDDATLLPGVAETLIELKRRGLRLGVVSNAAWPPFVFAALEKLGIAGAFDAVITSAGCGVYKSDPAIYALALSALGDVDPALALHVGDSFLYDVVGAQRAGLRGVWFNPNDTQSPAQSEIDQVLRIGQGAWRGRPDGIIVQFSELTAFLDTET